MLTTTKPLDGSLMPGRRVQKNAVVATTDQERSNVSQRREKGKEQPRSINHCARVTGVKRNPGPEKGARSFPANLNGRKECGHR